MTSPSPDAMRAALPRRLDKLLADARLGSRRVIEAALAAGRVTLNGLPARLPWTLVFPEEDEVRVDGARVEAAAPAWYLMLHKPCGVLTTLSDPSGRPTVAELLPAEARPVVGPVGRLDNMTSGLLLVTDDGDLHFLLTHPRHHVAKRYRLTLQVPAPLASADPRLEQLRSGLLLGDGLGPTRPARVEVGAAGPPGAGGVAQEVRLTITEGRNRQVRRMARAVGLHLTALHREAVGGLELGGLAEGALRALTPGEVRDLYAASGGEDLPQRRALAALAARASDPRTDPSEAARLRRWLMSRGGAY